MRPSQSLRSILVVGLLLAAGLAAATSCAVPRKPPTPVLVPLEDAVRRTVAAGSVRLRAEIRHRSGATVTVTGVASLREPASSIVAEVPGSPPAEVRVTAGGAWLRASSERPWVRVDPAAVEVAGAARGWSGLLGDLRAAAGQPARDGALRATLDGAAARVWVDGGGRIRRIVAEGRDATLELHLSDHGLPVEVHAP